MQLNESNVSHSEQCWFGSRAITKLCVTFDIISGDWRGVQGVEQQRWRLRHPTVDDDCFCQSSLFTSPPTLYCLFVFSSLIYLHKAQSLSCSPSHLIHHILFFFSSLFSHIVNCQGTAHQSEISIQMVDFFKPSRDKCSPGTKRGHSLSSNTSLIIFQSCGCADNKIGVVCIYGTVHYVAPFCVIMVHAKMPT